MSTVRHPQKHVLMLHSGSRGLDHKKESDYELYLGLFSGCSTGQLNLEIVGTPFMAQIIVFASRVC